MAGPDMLEVKIATKVAVTFEDGGWDWLTITVNDENLELVDIAVGGNPPFSASWHTLERALRVATGGEADGD